MIAGHLRERLRTLAAGLQRRQNQMLVLVGALLAALALLAGFYLGQHATYTGMGAKPKSYRAMQAELISVQERLRERDAELEIQRTRHEVDRQALELVRKDMAGQEEQIADLEEGLGFYRSLIAPGEIAPGLSLRQIELVALPEPSHFSYRIVVQQEARKHEELEGTLTAVVTGVLAGEPVEYPLVELSPDVESGELPLAFRYFQSVEGELVLPDGFDPRGVTVTAHTRTPRKLEVREVFPWQLHERFTHVGK